MMAGASSSVRDEDSWRLMSGRGGAAAAAATGAGHWPGSPSASPSLHLRCLKPHTYPSPPLPYATLDLNQPPSRVFQSLLHNTTVFNTETLQRFTAPAEINFSTHHEYYYNGQFLYKKEKKMRFLIENKIIPKRFGLTKKNALDKKKIL